MRLVLTFSYSLDLSVGANRDEGSLSAWQSGFSAERRQNVRTCFVSLEKLEVLLDTEEKMIFVHFDVVR